MFALVPWIPASFAVFLLTGPVPEVAAQTQAPISLEYTQLRLLGQGDEGDAIPFIVRRVGDTSQELTVNVRIEGLDDSGRYDPTDANDFDSSKTTSSLTFAADSTAPQTITVQTKTDTTYEPHERFEVVASGTYDGTDFEVRLEGRLFDAVRPTIDLTYTKPFRISEGDTGTVTFTITDLVPHPVNLSYSVMSRHTTSTEKIGDGGATMADHKMTSGMITIPANTKSVTFDVETVEDLIPEPDEQFIVIFKPEGQPPSSPQWNPVDRFTGDNRNHLERKVVVTIVDDDTPQQQQRLVYLHGTVSGGLTGATRATLDEGEEAELTVTLVGDAPTTDVSIPLKFTVFPASEATSSDYRTPASVTIKSGKKSGSVTLQIVDDSLDERHHELLAVEIDDSATSWPQGYTKGDRSRFEVIMRDNDKTSASLLNLSRAALTEAAGARTATFQVNIARRPKGSVTGTAPFVDVGLAEGRARLVLGYTGTAERGTDYRSATTITIPEGSSLPNGCSASGGVVTCTVTLTAIDDNLYEGGSGTTENVKIDLDVQNSRFNDGIARATGYKGHSLTIEDNDIQPTFSIADALGSEAGNLTFTVTRSGALGNDVSVTAATGNHGSATNPATAGADYTAKTESLRFEANDTQKTFQVTVTDDSIDEPDETFAVTLSRPVDNDRLPAPGIATSGGTAVGTITDNDDTPTATLVLTPVIIAESGEGNVSTVTATLSGASSAEVTLTVSVPDASPVTQSGSTLTIAPGRTTSTGVVTLTATDNNVDAPNTTVAVSATASGGGVVNPANATLTITDDDVATLSISDVTATEGATATFAVTLSTPSAADVTVTATTAEDSATDPEDYTHKAETLTIAAGVTAAEFAVTTIEDTLDEFDETFTVTLSDASVTITDATGTGTITDDDDPPVLSIKNVLLGYEGNKGATNLTHGVTLNPASGKTVTVKYADTGTGTAISGEGGDYAALSSGTLSFAPGETRKHIRIKANGDTDYEPDESIIVRLSEPVNATLAGGKSTLDATGWIENDDAAPVPTITPGDITVEEGKTAVFTVSRKHDFEELTVSYGTSPGSADEATNDEATSGSDYTAYNADSTAVFREGEDEITLEFETVDDDLHEAPEDFTVTIGSGDYSEDFTVTISDNDDPPKVTLALASSSISEKGGQTRLTASLDNPTSRELRLVVGTTPVTPAVAEDIKQTGQSLTIPAETKASTGAVTLTGVDNNVDAPDKTVTVSALLFGNADIDDPDAVTLTIEDDDAAPTALTLSVDADTGTDNVQDSLAENGGAKMVRVTARITSPTTFSVEKTVTVKVGKAADTAKEGTDYETVADQTITIPAGQTSATVDFTLMPKQDTRHEANETISIDGTLAGVTVTGTTITLTSEDAAPTTLTLTVDADTGTNGVQGSLAEAGGQKTVRVTATLGGTTQFDTPKTVTVAVGASDDSATEGTDYTQVADQTITIAAGAASGTVTFALTPTNDAYHEDDETISIDGTLASVTVTGTTITLTSEDVAATVTLTVDADTGTPSVQGSVAEAGGQKTVQVTATVSGTTRFATEQTVTVTVGDSGDSATEGTDYTQVADQTITIAAGAASGTVTFALTPTNDVYHEDDETISIDGTLASVTVTGTTITLTSEDAAATVTLTVDADTSAEHVQDSLAEAGGQKTVRVTATFGGTTRFATAQTVTVAVGDSGDSATEGTDYQTVADQTIEIPANTASAAVTFTLVPTNDAYHEADETISIEGELVGVTVTGTTITLTSEDAAATLTLTVDADTGTPSVQGSVAEAGGQKTVRVTATVGGTTRFATAQTVTVAVGDSGDSATEGTDYQTVADQTIEIPANTASAAVTFALTPTNDAYHEDDETISIDGTLASVTVTGTTITLTSEDAAATVTLTVDADTSAEHVQDSLAEAGGQKTVQVTATVSGTTRFATEQTVTVAVGDSDDSATEGTDYTTVADQTITIAAGAASGTVTFALTPTNDVYHEDDETISIEGTLTGVTVTGTTITLTSEDAAATVTLTVDADTSAEHVQDSLAEAGGQKTVRVTATVGGTTRFATAQTVTVAVGASDDSATEGTDYTTVADQTITIAAGAASGTVTFALTPTNDAYHEADETISIEGTLTGVTVTGTTITLTSEDAAATVTLTVDADTGTPSVQGSVAEAGGQKTVRVTATVGGTTRFATEQTVTVAVGASDDSATEGTDYTTVADQTITIAAGAASGTVTFALVPTNDAYHEADETISIEGELVGVTVTGTTITLTSEDAAATVTLTVDADTSAEHVQSSLAEAGGQKTVQVTATVSGTTRFATEQTVTVTVGDSGDSATEGTDYTQVADQTITIAAGAASGTVTFALTPTNDVYHEADETISIDGTLASVTVTGTTITLTSEDAAATVTLTVDADTSAEHVQDSLAEAGGQKTVRVTATFGGTTRFATAQTVTVAVGDSGDSATEGTDYQTVADQTIEIPANTASAAVTFTLTPTNDVYHEADETISIEGTLTSVTVTGTTITLTSEDVAATLTLTVDADTGTPSVQGSVAEAGGQKTVRVTATVGGTTRFATAQTVTVAVGDSDDSATEGTDYTTVADQTITIAAGAASGTVTFALTPTNDAYHEDDETISIDGTLASVTVTGTTITLTSEDAAATVTLTVDADTGTPSVQGSVAEAGGQKTVRVTATVGGTTRFATEQTVTVAVGASGDSATEGTDYTQVADQTITIAAGAASGTVTFALTPTNDAFHEADETISIEGTLTGVTVTGTTITLTSEDVAATLTLTVDADTGTPSVQGSVAEAGGQKTVRVTATVGGTTRFATEQTVTVAVGDSDDSATEGTDYTTVADQTITIAAGAASGTVTFALTPTNDAYHEADETISIDGTLASVTVTGTTITLTSEDVAATVTLTVDADTDTPSVQGSVAEAGGAKTVRVTATVGGTTRFATEQTVTVTVGQSDDSATEGTDYTTVADQTITIAAGAASGTVTFALTPTNDTFHEADETISIDGTLAGVTVTGTTITLTSEDAAVTTLTLTVDADTGTNDVQTSVAENGGRKTVRVTATLGTTRFATEQTVTVTVGKAADSAAEGTDYTTVADQTITIAAGAASGTVTFALTPTNDAFHEADETISIDGTLASVTVTGTTITLTSEDTAITTVTLTVDADTGAEHVQGSLAEAGGQKTVQVTATVSGTTRFATEQTVTVTVGQAADSATEGTDYTQVADQTITIAAGAASGTVTFALTPTNDTFHEADETISIDGTLAGVTVTGTTITLTSEDAAVTTLTLTVDADTGTNDVQTSVAENGGRKTVRVTATLGTTRFATEQTVTVTVGKAADSAAEGTDYTTVADQTITIAAGAASGTVTFALTPTNDAFHEADETISIDGTLASVTVTGTTITLTSEDTAITTVTLTVDADTGAEHVQGSLAEAGGQKTVQVTATVSGTTRFATEQTVTVTVGQAADSATEGTDYTQVADQTITIAAGAASGTVTFALTPTNDAFHEADETISIDGTLTSVTVTGTTITLTSEDTAVTTLTLTVDADTGTNGVQTSVAENGGRKTVQVTATVSGTTRFATEQTVTVTVGQAADSATEGTDYTQVADQTITIAAGAASGTVTFALTPTNDTFHEADETISIDGTLTSVTVTGTTITLTSEDTAVTTLTLTVDADTGTNDVQTSVAENGGRKTVRVTATLGTTRFATEQTVTVTVGQAADSATEGTDYTQVADQTITIAAGAASGTVTFALTPTNDAFHEADETISIDGTLAGVTVTGTTITLTSEDAAVTTLTLTVDADTGTNDVQTSVAENGGQKTVQVTATVSGTTRFATEQTVTVTVGQAADSAAEGTDYTQVADQTITIAAGAASGTVTFALTPTNDAFHEADETISIDGTLASVTVTGTTITLTSEDTAITTVTLTVDADTGAEHVQGSLAEAGGQKTVQVTATVSGTTRFATEQTVTVTVGQAADSATEGTDYTQVADQTITIAAGAASGTVTFALTPTNDAFHEADETISIDGTLAGVTVTGTTITLTSEDAAVTTLTLTVDADTGTNDVQTSVAENGGRKTVRVTATLGTTRFATEQTVTVTVGKAADSATEGTDYTQVADQTITIAAGAASGTVTFALTPTNDAFHEADETISIDGTLAGVTVTGTTITLTSEDAAVTTLTLTVDADTGTNDVQTSVAENGGRKTVRVTATLGTTRFATEQTVTVTVGKAADSAAEGTDYTQVADQTITIAAGAASGTVTFALTPTNDAFHEADETISIDGTLTSVTVTGTTITLTSEDTAITTVTLTVDADTGTNGVQSSLAEAGGAKTVRVTATVSGTTRFATEQTVTVTVGDSGDSATEGTDYTQVADQTITIAAGAASGTVTFALTPTNDAFHEADETISIDGTLTSVTVTGTTITLTSEDTAITTVTLTVDADTGAEHVQSSLAEAGGQKTVQVTATVSGTTRFATEQTVTVTVGDSGDSAAEGTDYTQVADQTITIAAGAASGTVTFALTPTNDAFHEADETISIDGTLAGVTVTGTTITLTSEDAAVTTLTLTVDADTGTNDVQTSVAENGGRKTVRVTATLGTTRFATEQTVTVTVGKAADSAAEGTDYTQVADQTITIAAGAASGTVTFALTPTNDAFHEADETISIDGTLTSVTVTGTTITLTSEDTAITTVTLTVDADTGAEHVQSSLAEAGGQKTVQVTATVSGTTRFATEQTVTVTVGKAADSATEGTDYTQVADQTITIAAGAASGTVTFALTPTNDAFHEANETISIDGTLAGVTVTGTTITLTSEDAAVTTLTLTVDADTGTNDVQTSVAENGGRKTVRVTATLGTTRFATEQTVTVTVGKAADSAAEGTDYTQVADQTITIAAGAASGTVTFALTPTNDAFHEADETISIDGTLTSVTVTGTTITLTSEDTAITTVTLTVDADTGAEHVQSSLAEAGGQKTVQVTATVSGTTRFATEQTVTVTVGKAADSATEGTDYTQVADQTITIAAGAASGTVTFALTPTNDAFHEADETISIDGTLAGVTVTGTTITLTSEDTAITTVTLTVDADTGTNGVQTSVAENGGRKTVRVTATLGGTHFAVTTPVTVKVGKAADSATEGTDYETIADQTISIPANTASASVTFALTPTNDAFHEADETISIDGELTGATVTGTTITLTSEDAAVTALTLSVDADTGTEHVQNSLAEDGGQKTVRVTATLDGTSTFTEDQTVTVTVGKTADSATEGTDYATVADQTITIPANTASASVTFTLTPTNDAFHEEDETISIEGELTGVTVTGTTITLTSEDTAVTALTLSVDADTDADGIQTSVAEGDDPKTVRVTAMLDGTSTFTEDQTVTVTVGQTADSATERSRNVNTAEESQNGDTATEGADYETVADQEIVITAGEASAFIEFTLTPKQDIFYEGTESISVDGELTDVTVTYATIEITDDDTAPDALTLSVDTDTDTDGTQTSVAEDGGAKTVRVTATLDDETTRFATDQTVTVVVGQNGDTATEGTDYETVADQEIVITAGEASAFIEFTLTPKQDTSYEGTETISVEGELTGVTVAPTTIEMTDEEEASPVNLSVLPDSVVEGQPVTVMAQMTRALSDPVTIPVTLTSNTAKNEDYETLANISIPANSRTGTGTIATRDNYRDENDKTFTVALGDLPAMVTRGTPASVLVTILDDDEAGIDLSTASLRIDEKTDGTARYSVKLRSEPMAPVTVTVASDSTDIVTVSPAGLTFTADDWNVGKAVTVTAGVNGSARVTHTASSSDGKYAGLTTTLQVQVDERFDTSAWLIRFSRTHVGHVLDGIAERMQVSPQPGVQVSLGGQAVEPGTQLDDNGLPPLATDRPIPNGPESTAGTQTVTAREVLMGTSFALTGEKTANGSTWSVWGRGARSYFDGREGALELDGDVTTAMLGIDRRQGRWLTGLVLTHGLGEGDYSRVDGRSGRMKSHLTMITPWVSHELNDRITAWGAFGYGQGGLTFKMNQRKAWQADTKTLMAATGARGTVIGTPAASGFGLAVNSDALWLMARSDKEDSGKLVPTSSQLSRLRLGLEGSYRIAMEDGGLVTPTLASGVRHDAGDAETGFGIELGGGLAWSNPMLGLGLNVEGRTLLAHTADDFKNWGFAASFAFEPDPVAKRGPSFSLSQKMGGQANGGVDALFTPDPLEKRSSEATARWTAEAAYGFPAFGGRFTGSPYIGFGLATGMHNYTLGWRLTPAGNGSFFSFDLKATRQESENAEPQHDVRFEVTTRW